MGGGAGPRCVAAQWRAEPLTGVRLGPPLRAGLAVGVAYGTQSRAAQFGGPIVLAEVGLGGGRVSAGYVLAYPFATGVEVLGSAIRTWASPTQVERGVTLAGSELRLLMFAVNVGLGVFRPVDGFGEDRRTRYYLNVGLGI
jgi:hypothetical protein